jgi:hypothetical protein
MSLDTEEQLSGRAADAITDIVAELQRRYSGLNSAESALAEALLNAHATSDAGRRRLQDIQRQLIEAIANPVNALDTPAGERQFLTFLRGKVAEIRSVVADGAVTAEDQAAITRALGNGYLSDSVAAAVPDGPPPQPAASSAPQTTAAPQPAAASMMPSAGSAMPQGLGQSQPFGGLGSAAGPLAGLASLLAGHERELEAAEGSDGGEEPTPHKERAGEDAHRADGEDEDEDGDDHAKDGTEPPSPSSDEATPPPDAPARTRPAG